MQKNVENFLDAACQETHAKKSSNKWVSKLCLKKNIRRSSMIDSLPSTRKNSNLILADLPISSSSSNRDLTTITISDESDNDQSLIVSETSLEEDDKSKCSNLNDYITKRKKDLEESRCTDSVHKLHLDDLVNSLLICYQSKKDFTLKNNSVINNEKELDNLLCPLDDSLDQEIRNFQQSTLKQRIEDSRVLTKINRLFIDKTWSASNSLDLKGVNDSSVNGEILKNVDNTKAKSGKTKKKCNGTSPTIEMNEFMKSTINETHNNLDAIKGKGSSAKPNGSLNTCKNNLFHSLNDSLDKLLDKDSLEERLLKHKVSACNNIGNDDPTSSSFQTFQLTNCNESTDSKLADDEGLNSSDTFAENVLDELYGRQWRKNRTKILTPKTAPRLRRRVDKENRCPKTEIKKPNRPSQRDRNWQHSSYEASISADSSDSDIAPFGRAPKGRQIFDTDSSDDTKKKTLSLKSAQCSFLESLSGSVIMSKCDPMARFFRTTFKTTKEDLTQKLFDLYNAEIFGSRIPKSTPLNWNSKMLKTAGFCYCRKITKGGVVLERTVRIELSSKVLTSADRLRDTLVHELCHAATWIVNQVSDGHGPFWKAWAAKAKQKYPELPSIERCHNYTIKKKYTYSCTKCGYSISRHSKSINTDRKCCGYCHGRFELLINKDQKNGGIKSVPVTKKAPTGFALYVKDNYSQVKRPNLSHADVMRILGEKFGQMKVQSK